LLSARPELRGHFASLGDVFWFDQYRNLGSLAVADEGRSAAGRPGATGGGESTLREGWHAGVEQLRDHLVRWWSYHLRPRQFRDFIALLEASFQSVFPGTRFVGTVPRLGATDPRENDFYFLMARGDREYDLAEMSSGEQAVFPLVYEFVQLDIRRSIVLIDELELHLHPPEQQRLLAALPRIGPDCQFLITTHSEYLSSAIPNEQEVRLDGGARCL
jgi:hypothetical protein